MQTRAVPVRTSAFLPLSISPEHARIQRCFTGSGRLRCLWYSTLNPFASILVSLSLEAATRAMNIKFAMSETRTLTAKERRFLQGNQVAIQRPQRYRSATTVLYFTQRPFTNTLETVHLIWNRTARAIEGRSSTQDSGFIINSAAPTASQRIKEILTNWFMRLFKII
jgi:hypothetical protein